MSNHHVPSNRFSQHFSGKVRHCWSGLSLLLLVSPVSTAYSVSVQLIPVKDNTIYSESSNSNGSGTSLFAGQIRQGSTRRALMLFDVADSVPTGAVINSVSLRMVVTRSNNAVGSRTAALHRLTSDWGEGTSSGTGQGSPASTGDATWSRAFFNTLSWNSSGGDFVGQASATANAGEAAVIWSSDGLVSDVQAWVNGQDDFGWLLRVDESRRSAKQFASRENGAVAERPTLTIDYTLPKTDQMIAFNAIPSQALERVSLTLDATATSGLEVSFSVISGPATLEGNVLTLTGLGIVIVRASQAGDAAFNPASDVDQTFEINTAIDNWVIAHFTETELLEPAISGGGADPDKDGLPNDAEYALGLNPRVPSSLFTGENSFFINEAGDSLVLRFSRNPDAFDATITIEESFDLALWTSVATSVDGAVFQPTLEGYTVSESSGEGVLNVELIGLFASPATRFQRIMVVR